MSGQRAESRVNLVVDVIHDGDPSVLGDHLAAEIAGLLVRWGHDGAAVVVDVSVIAEGDGLSRLLPTIGCAHQRPRPQPPVIDHEEGR